MVQMLAPPVRPAVDLDVLLASHLRRGLQATVLEHRTATVVFDTGDGGLWTIDIADGRGRARRGGAPDPTLRVTARADVLADIVQANTSGVNAFLAGDLTVRGDLALFRLRGGRRGRALCFGLCGRMLGAAGIAIRHRAGLTD